VRGARGTRGTGSVRGDRTGSGGGPAAEVLAGAARTLVSVTRRGRSADAALAEITGALRASIQAVTLGSLRWYPRLERLAGLLLEGRRIDGALAALLVASLFQLEYSRNPPEACVSAAVDAARLLGQPRAAGLVNALLRRSLRERETLATRLAADPVAASAHPAWLLAALQAAWPVDWPAIVAADNGAPPLTLRVDLSRISLEQYQAQLQAAGLAATRIAGCPAALVLERAVPVDALPGFAEGLASVQDAGAQLAAPLLAVEPGQRVLDACAAPGGKTGALLELAGGTIELTALDVDAQRLERVAGTLARLRRTARLVRADLTRELDWWDGRRFDRILLDAPCSALGVIRRHPDIKLLRRREDIAALAQVQARLLEQCLAMLAPGGRLLYCTCSVLPEENDQVVAAVLEAAPGARLWPPEAWQVALPADSRPCRSGIQLLPGSAALTDGFYYACLTIA
jgi:16S rRNA (cytosine967-C5)-methyltransferase